jgi:hypothetical protein
VHQSRTSRTGPDASLEPVSAVTSPGARVSRVASAGVSSARRSSAGGETGSYTRYALRAKPPHQMQFIRASAQTGPTQPPAAAPARAHPWHVNPARPRTHPSNSPNAASTAAITFAAGGSVGSGSHARYRRTYTAVGGPCTGDGTSTTSSSDSSVKVVCTASLLLHARAQNTPQEGKCPLAHDTGGSKQNRHANSHTNPTRDASTCAHGPLPPHGTPRAPAAGQGSRASGAPPRRLTSGRTRDAVPRTRSDTRRGGFAQHSSSRHMWQCTRTDTRGLECTCTHQAWRDLHPAAVNPPRVPQQRGDQARPHRSVPYQRRRLDRLPDQQRLLELARAAQAQPIHIQHKRAYTK